MLRCALALLLAGLATWAGADERINICYGYGCLVQADIPYSEGQLGDVRRALFAASDAAGERAALAGVIGRMYGWAGELSDIRNDRGGNYADAGVAGKMDCIRWIASIIRRPPIVCFACLNGVAICAGIGWRRSRCAILPIFSPATTRR